jgi:uncharacterized membrane protein
MKKDGTRFIYIDLLRGWALIIMIEVHIFNALLLLSLKDTSWFKLLTFINGLVAPSFLFVSGFAFIISSERRIEELRKFGKYFWNKLSRIGLIFLAGYSLHLPFFSFSKIINKTSAAHLITWFNVDILQCIALGLLLLLILRIVIKKDRLFYAVIISLTVLISFSSPVIWQIDFANYIPIFFADYLSQLHGSFFPVFPWLFFLLAGAIYSKFYIDLRNAYREKEFIRKVFLYSLIPIFLGHLFLSDLFDLSIFSIHPNPLFLYERLGYVLVLASFFWYYSSQRETKKSFVLDVSRESLLVYWLHLQVIYSKIWNGRSIAEIISNNFSVIECTAATFLIILFMIIVAKLWGGFKKKNPVLTKPITAGIITIAIIVFMLR